LVELGGLDIFGILGRSYILGRLGLY